MQIASEVVVSGTPAGVAWGATPDGKTVLALTGSTRTIIVFDHPNELLMFGAMASHQAVEWLQRTAAPGAAGPQRASGLVGADNLPLVRS